jgi:hypothetical protein
MTTVALEATSAAGSFAAYVVGLAEALEARRESQGLCLLLAPSALPESGQVVYVQGPPREDGTITLYPVRVSDLKDGDILAATQRIDPTDAEFVQAYLASGYYGRNDHCGKDSLTQTHQYD